VRFCRTSRSMNLLILNPLNAELNPICHLLALLGAHHILHVSRIRAKLGLDGNGWWASRPGRFTLVKYWRVGRVCPRASLGLLLQNLKICMPQWYIFSSPSLVVPTLIEKKMKMKHTRMLVLQLPINQTRIPEEIKSKLNSGIAYYHSVRELLSFSLLAKNVYNKKYRTIGL